MASGFDVNGTDLDSIFAPYHSGWPQQSACGYLVNGVDLNARYAKISSGSGAAATGMYAGAGPWDLNAYFAAAGTTGVRVATQPANVSGSSAAGNPSGTVTSSAATCAFAGGGGSYSVQWHCTNCTANSPNSLTTTFSAVVGAASTDNANAYCTGSDGVTSVNTDTISVTLQNTSLAQFSGTFVIDSTEETGGNGTTYFTYTYGGNATSSALSAGETAVSFSCEETVSQSITSYSAELQISGPNLGAAGFNAINALSSSGATYSYSGGAGTWTWSGSSGSIMVVNETGSVTLTIT